MPELRPRHAALITLEIKRDEVDGMISVAVSSENSISGELVAAEAQLQKVKDRLQAASARNQELNRIRGEIDDALATLYDDLGLTREGKEPTDEVEDNQNDWIEL